MQESAAISSDAAGTVPLELLALLMKLKHHLDPEAPGLPDKVTGEMVEDLKAAAKLLHEAFKDISDATLEVAMHGLSSRRSQWGRWLQFYRANYAAISSRRCNYANALEEFVTSYNAVYNPPSAANTASAVEEPYANLVKHFKARMKQVTYQSGAGTLTFTPIGRNTVPFSRKLADLHLTSADFGNVDRTFNSAADVKSIPAFAQIVEDYIVGIQNKLNPSKAMSAAYASANARHARANPAYNVRQEKFGYEFSCTGFQDYFLSTNNLKIIEDFISGGGVMIDAASMLGFPAVTCTLKRAKDAGPAPSDAQLAIIRRWVSSAHALHKAAVAMNKNKDEIKELVRGYMSRHGEVQGQGGTEQLETGLKWRSKHEPNSSGGYIHQTAQYKAKGLSHLYALPRNATEAPSVDLWKQLAVYAPMLVDLGGLYALLIDISKHHPFHLVDSIRSMRRFDAGVPESMGEGGAAKHTHECIEEKIVCEEDLNCTVCNEKYKCKLAGNNRMLQGLMCPLHAAMYAGVAGKTPLEFSVQNLVKKEDRQNQSPSEFLAAHYKSLQVPSDLVSLSLKIADANKSGCEVTIKAIEDEALRLHLAEVPGFNTVLAYESWDMASTVKANTPQEPVRVWTFQRIYRNTTGVELGANALGSSRVTTIRVTPVPVYKSAFHGVLSYDHRAAPATLVSSLDQHRTFKATSAASSLGHVVGNMDVVPVHLNFLKHTAAPEFVTICAIKRFLKVSTEEVKADAPEDQLADLRQASDAMNEHLDAIAHLTSLIPHKNQDRIAALTDETLRAQVFEAYAPIVAFGKRAGHVDDYYDDHGKVDKGKGKEKVTSPKEAVDTVNLSDLDESSEWEEIRASLYQGTSTKTAEGFLKYISNSPVIKDLMKKYGIPDECPLKGFGEWLSLEFVQHKYWHYLLIIEWCDEFGVWWIAFLFITFWVVNVKSIHACDGICPILDIPLTGFTKDLAAYADAHFIHGLSIFYKVQKAKKVTSLDDIDFDALNMSVQSRAANYWLSNHDFADIQVADAQLLYIGQQRFQVLFPDLYKQLAELPGYKIRADGWENGLPTGSSLGFEKGPYNVIYELPDTHALHPKQGLTHITY